MPIFKTTTIPVTSIIYKFVDNALSFATESKYKILSLCGVYYYVYIYI